MRNRLTALLLCVVLSFGLCGCGGKKTQNDGKLKIVTTVFPLYDFVRATGGNKVDITLLIDPGTEVHSFDPTPSDAVATANADIFFCIGGESETWAEKLSDGTGGETVRLMDSAKLLYEDGEDEYDEHIWTSPSNAELMIEKICDVMCRKDNENAEYYRKNAELYKAKIQNVSEEIRKTVDKSEKKFILVADRFPFKYFANEYGLSYEAAFGGCASDTDISLKKMIELTDAVKERNVKVVFHTELSNKAVADALVETTGVKTAELHSAHNVTVDDFKAGITYVDIMERNAKALKEGLN